MWYSRRLKNSFELETVSLLSLKKGERGVIYSLKGISSMNSSHLQALGLGEGAPFLVLNTYPSYYLALEEERVALDRELASSLKVISFKEESRETCRKDLIKDTKRRG